MIDLILAGMAADDDELPTVLRALRRTRADVVEAALTPLIGLADAERLSPAVLDELLPLAELAPVLRLVLAVRADLARDLRRSLLSGLDEDQVRVLFDSIAAHGVDDDGRPLASPPPFPVDDELLAETLLRFPSLASAPVLHHLRDPDAIRSLIAAWSAADGPVFRLRELLGNPDLPDEVLGDVPVRFTAAVADDPRRRLVDLVRAACAGHEDRWTVLARTTATFPGTVAELLDLAAATAD